MDQVKFVQYSFKIWSDVVSVKTDHIQTAFTCSKLKIKTLEHGVKYVQS